MAETNTYYVDSLSSLIIDLCKKLGICSQYFKNREGKTEAAGYSIKQVAGYSIKRETKKGSNLLGL
jgi:hypothetical protein